jgi:hypothetical protein
MSANHNLMEANKRAEGELAELRNAKPEVSNTSNDEDKENDKEANSTTD